MERSKYILVLFLFLLQASQLNASYRIDIYNAYISNDMRKWKTVIDKMNLVNNKTDAFMLELINYHYGYIAYCIGIKNNKEAKKYMEIAEKYMATLEQKKFKPSYLNSYKSAFYGFNIGLNIFKAPFIGSKSIECAELSIKQDTINPYGYIQLGNSQFYMPKTFGGSKVQAIKFYLKAEQLMETSGEEIKYNWNYLNLLTLIGKAYEDIDDYVVAKSYYEKMLKLEPEYLWVKLELYPGILKKFK